MAFPGRVVAIDAAGAVVETEGRLRRASTLLVDDLSVGDWVTVAAGTILARLDPVEAAEIQELMRTATTPGGPNVQMASARIEKGII